MTAYAHVLSNGTLDTSHSRNVTAIAGANGLFCFSLSFHPNSAVATIADDPTAPSQALGIIEVALPPTPTFTCNTIPHPDAVVLTSNDGGTRNMGGHAFYVYWSK